jgi:hypothetical protein
MYLYQYCIIIMFLKFSKLTSVAVNETNNIYVHTTHALSPKGKQRHLKYSSKLLSYKELEGPAVSALSMRSQKLSNVRKGYRIGDQNLQS